MDKESIVKAWEHLVSLLPGWATEKANLFLLADQELVIHQAIGVGLEPHIKKDRCIHCGDCCLETPDGHTPFGSDDEEKCNVLYKEGDKWLCGAEANRPFRCLADPMKGNVPTCHIRYLK